MKGAYVWGELVSSSSLVERWSSEYTAMKTGRAKRKNEELLFPPPLLSPPTPSTHTTAASWESDGIREL